MIYSVLICVSYALLLIASCTALENEPNIPASELSALNDLYVSTGGPHWYYRLTDDVVVWNFTEANPNPCLQQWYGVSCITDASNSDMLHVSQLILNGNTMYGFIPESIGNLSYLVSLDFSYNYLNGTLPSSLGQLQLLVNFSVGYNAITGPIPDSIWSLRNMRMLELSDNALNGTISSAIEGFHCSILDLYHNLLSGTLPSEFGSIAGLQYLTLSNNKFIGNLSSSIGALTDLVVLDISENKLTGQIPDELTDLVNLEVMGFFSNSFTGTIPERIGKMASLKKLALQNNQLTSSIPDSLYDLASLEVLYLSGNLLTGTLSNDVARLKKLTHIYIDNNHLNGSIPDLSSNLHLMELNAATNELTGTLPESLTSLVSLRSILLSHNQLIQSIPDSYCTFRNLTDLDLDHNQLTSSLPSCIGSYGMPLTYSSFNDNFLDGTLPESLYNFSTGLGGGFYMSNNLFSGTISNQLSRIGYAITSFQFGYNMFTGTIPKAVSNFYNLVEFVLEYNRFTGTLPPITISHYLETIFINDNQFSGRLDDALVLGTDNPQLINFDVSNNQFTGPVPALPFTIEYFQTFAGVSNCFTGSLPQEICGATSLLTLALDGLRSASSCQRRFFPSSTTIKSYWLDGEIEGGIPECVFQLPKLKILHLSGNGFSGSLPGSLSLASGNLTDLSLSNNNLKGSIPDELQRRQFSNLDLSYNKMGGTLSGDLFASYESGASLSLEVNRLSGELPASLRNLEDVSVLDGNIFSCDADRTQIPHHDPDSRDYECGSNTFNYSMYVWIGVFGVLNLLCVFVMGVRGSDEVENESGGGSAGSSWMRPFDREDNKRGHGGVVELGLFLSQYRLLCSCIGVLIVVVCLPVNSVLSVYFNTYVYEYAWTVTSAYLSGVAPAVTLLLMVLLLFVVAGVALRRTILKLGDRTMLQWDKKTSRSWRQWFVILSVIVFDMVLMVGMNVAYVYIHSQYDSTIVQITQICVSLFKIAWNNIVIRLVLQLSKKFRGENVDRASSAIKTDVDASSLLNPRDSAVGGQVGSIAVGIGIMLFNNLAAPFIATAFVSSDCFYTVISTPPDVTVSYLYSECTAYEVTPEHMVCVNYEFGSDPRSTSYTPPFIYSYQCSSTFITTYVSIYVFMFIFIGFVAPAWKLLLLWLMNNTEKGTIVNSLSARMVPRIMKPPSQDAITRSSSTVMERTSEFLVLFDLPFGSERLFDCEVFVVQLANLLVVLVTFGLVVPAVAVVGVVTVYCVSYFTQWCIGRYVVSARKSSTGAASLEALESDCEGAAVMLLRSLWLLVPFVVIFYSFLLFDILGDEEGWRKAIWMPVSIVSLMSLLWFLRPWFVGLLVDERLSWRTEQRLKLDEEANAIAEKLISD